MAPRPIPNRDTADSRAPILEQVLASKQGLLRAQARRNAPSLDLAEDALQEGCIEFLRYYRGESDDHAIAWLMLAVKHRAWAIGKRDRRSQARGELSLGTAFDSDAALSETISERPDPVEVAERGEEVRGFIAALARLKPDERTALLLLGLGYSYAEVMDRQVWSYRKVSRCISEGRAALRAHMQDADG